MESEHEQDNKNQVQHNKFLIKLKMPHVKQDEEEQEHVMKNNTPRVCPECNKEFGSGKALGGHMRIHAEAIKKKQRGLKNKMVYQTVKDDMQRTMNKRAEVCSLCLKEFPSTKSLSGHMRCHPEREWRGIQPPLINNHDFSSEDDEDDDDDDDDDDCCDDDDGDAFPVSNLLAAMPKWGEKARRGRKGVRNNSFHAAGSSGVMVSEEDHNDDKDESEEEEERLLDAVNDLMLLKQVEHCSESSGVSTLAAAAVVAAQNAGLDQHQEVSFSNSLTISRGDGNIGNFKFQGSAGFEQGSHNKQMKRSFPKVDDEYDDHHLVMERLGMEEGGSNDHVMKNISDHHMGLETNAAHHDVEDEYDSRRRTELLVMNNNGGHNNLDWVNNKDDNVEMVMGSSRNKKAKKMKLMMDLDQEKPSAAGGSAQAAVSVSINTEKYRCSTCNKSFSSHQALGGHRSSHNKFKLTIINADSGTNNQPHQFSSVNVDHHRVQGNEEFDQNQHQHQLITSPDKVNKMMSEECANKKDSTNEGAGSSKGDHSSSTIHQCEVCNKIFPTGQALGGHKRCHWSASADQTESQPQAQAQAPLGMTSSGEEASTQTGGNHIQNIGIDLNFPPPMEDGFEAQVAGADTEHATRLHL